MGTGMPSSVATYLKCSIPTKSKETHKEQKNVTHTQK